MSEIKKVVIDSDGTVSGTHIFGPDGEEIQNVIRVEWEFDIKEKYPRGKIITREQSVTIEAETEIMTEEEATADWKRYTVRHMNVKDLTIHVTDMEAGVRKTVWIDVRGWDTDPEWANLKAGDVIKCQEHTDAQGEVIVTALLKV